MPSILPKRSPTAPPLALTKLALTKLALTKPPSSRTTPSEAINKRAMVPKRTPALTSTMSRADVVTPLTRLVQRARAGAPAGENPRSRGRLVDARARGTGNGTGMRRGFLGGGRIGRCLCTEDASCTSCTGRQLQTAGHFSTSITPPQARRARILARTASIEPRRGASGHEARAPGTRAGVSYSGARSGVRAHTHQCTLRGLGLRLRRRPSSAP
jgi:hypothetical protein